MGTKPALVLGVNDPVCAQLKDTAVVHILALKLETFQARVEIIDPLNLTTNCIPP